jgi:hypothetical protein
MRLELRRPSRERLQLRVAKERYGRIGGPHLLELGVGPR